MSVIRVCIQPIQTPFLRDISRHATTLMPMPNSRRQGTANNSRDDLFTSAFSAYVDMYPFYQFHGFQDHVKGNNNMLNRWISDNCQETAINGNRQSYGLIGDFNNSVILQDLKEDIANMLYVRDNGKELASNFSEVYKSLFSNGSFPQNPLVALRSDSYIHDDPFVFKDEEQFMEFIS